MTQQCCQQWLNPRTKSTLESFLQSYKYYYENVCDMTSPRSLRSPFQSPTMIVTQPEVCIIPEVTVSDCVDFFFFLYRKRFPVMKTLLICVTIKLPLLFHRCPSCVVHPACIVCFLDGCVQSGTVLWTQGEQKIPGDVQKVKYTALTAQTYLFYSFKTKQNKNKIKQQPQQKILLGQEDKR